MNQYNLLEYMRKQPSLHKDIVEILFRNKNDITRKLSDIQGFHYIDHVSIHIIDPDSCITIFSLTPSVEYNLIAQGLWRYDKSFFPFEYKDYSYFWWDEAYSNQQLLHIKQLKEYKHNFTIGLCLVRKMSQFQIVYSYATRSQNDNLHAYYKSVMSELFLIGDYGLNLIGNIYAKYSSYSLPYISRQEADLLKKKSKIKLIVDNSNSIIK